MSARTRREILTVTCALAGSLCAPASATRPAQGSSAGSAAQASSTEDTNALPAEIQGVLEDARNQTEEAFAAADAADVATARALGERAADLLFPLLEVESLTASEALRSELHATVKLVDRLNEIGALGEASALGRLLVQRFEKAGATEYVELFYCRAILAFVEGDFDAAARFLELEVETRERMQPADHPDLLLARMNLAVTLESLGDLARARELQESVLAAYQRSLPADHPDLLRARANLAATLGKLGDLARARELEEGVLAAYERTLPADHPDLLRGRANLATTLWSLGDFVRARELQESVLAAYQRSLPADHTDLLLARANLAATLWSLGDFARARELQESVLAGRERTLPADHPDLTSARANLAVTLWSLGDFARARELQESVLAAYQRTLPADHTDHTRARASLAATLWSLGDFARARELQESVLAGRERTLPADHPDLTRARASLAATLWSLGDFARARELQESALAGRERTLPADHPNLISARANLAATLGSLGDLARARELKESVLAAYERTLPADYPDLLRARGNLAGTLWNLGDFARARELQESVLAAYERSLPVDHPDLLSARANLALTLWSIGDLEPARSHQPPLVSGLLRRALGLAAVSPREARAVAAADADRVANAIFLSDSPETSARHAAFELVETRRHMSQALPQPALFSDPEIEGWRAEAASLRGRLSDLISGSSGEDTREDLAGDVSRLTFERDRVERRIRAKLADKGAFADTIRAEALARTLPQGSAAVGYLRYRRKQLDTETKKWSSEDALLAHVVRAGGEVVRIELGPAGEIEELMRAWRAALGKPIERGIAADASGEDLERAAGEALRARVLDPLLAAVAGENELETLYVCLDDMLFLVPLDALPLGEGRVGEHYRIVNEVSFAQLLAPAETLTSKPSLLALGGASFEAAFEDGDAPMPGAATPPLERAERSGRPESFAPLLQTRLEVETLAELFEEAFDVEAVLLTREKATKRALHDNAPGARFLHLATHGWFAPESVASVADAHGDDGWDRMGLEETVTGFAPMTLCGLALAGANHGRDALGRVPGILTAEELSSLDLSRCELAVLSACETNVGVRRAGQGIQSLQAALHAAGARTAITSLWKVDDAATRRLMELVYTKLWSEKAPKAQALWEAKMALRAEGAPVRDWAGWVLSGDPD